MGLSQLLQFGNGREILFGRFPIRFCSGQSPGHKKIRLLWYLWRHLRRILRIFWGRLGGIRLRNKTRVQLWIWKMKTVKMVWLWNLRAYNRLTQIFKKIMLSFLKLIFHFHYFDHFQYLAFRNYHSIIITGAIQKHFIAVFQLQKLFINCWFATSHLLRPINTNR